MKARSKLVNKRYANGLDYAKGPDVFDGDSLEHKLIWQYLFDASDLPLHIRRTLDQYGYPSLDDTSRRDKDQVMHRAMRLQVRSLKKKKKKASGGQLNLPLSNILQTRPQVGVNLTPKRDKIKVLMVDQFWCWVVDKGAFLLL
jgi:hypothetical protein